MAEQQTTRRPPEVFDTPEPVRLRVEVPAGRVEVRAEPVSRTTIQVLPHSERREPDRRAAERTTVVKHGNGIHVEAPRQRAELRNGAIRVLVSVPVGSGLDGSVASADLDATGELGAGTVKTASGEVRLEKVGAFSLRTASGDIAVDHVTGDLEVNGASGDIRVGQVDGEARVGTASGDITLGAVQGELRSTTASGDTRVRAVARSATVSTTSGDVELERVGSGTVETKAVSGDVTIGVPSGVAAWLQLRSISGDVRTRLESTDAPEEGESTVRIIANAVSGDITIRRAGG